MATGPNPPDPGKPGTKCHVLTDASGVPLAVNLTGATVHDGQLLEAVVDAVPPIRSCWGPPHKRPSKLHIVKAYDPRCRQTLTRCPSSTVQRYPLAFATRWQQPSSSGDASNDGFIRCTKAKVGGFRIACHRSL